MTTEDQHYKNKDTDYEVDTLTNDRLIKGHEYDGIRELDNDLPPWWKWLFILCIVFATIYLVRLWVFRSDDLIQRKEFEKELAVMKTSAAVTASNAEAFELVLLSDGVSLANGKETWLKICSVCHLLDGGGLVGPNMTDNYWIHGNKIEDLFAVLENGVIEKGMISYKDQLSPKQRLEVTSYVLNELVGSTPSKPKEPQGDLYE
ncbi:MAG: cytochrome oxidase subunit III [Bacteroidetes bacterium HGW-Bacteroidetes-1]|jgi:cytochrome c oxidase cbb3-type subunit 3|nr:MAG: cytochrome oxidase subunit III [Bacteroidetes bacterium HGW-Bacteroidetes-1]